MRRSNEIPVLLVFTAVWCSPCRILKQSLRQIVRDDVEIQYLDVEEQPDIASAYSIRSVPTLILFRGEKAVARINGVMSEIALNNWLDIELI